MIAMASEAERRALDALARDVLGTLTGLEFRTATTPEEVDATFRLRYEAVIENGWAGPEDYPDGRERDAEDERAVCVVCLDGGRVVGSLRLVKPLPDRPLPTERDFELRLGPVAVVDAGRVVVARSHRGALSHLVLTGLVARGWLEARALGFERIVGAASPRAMSLYEGLGMQVAALGQPRPYWGEDRTPIEILGAVEAVVAAHDVEAAPASDDADDQQWSPAVAGISRRDLIVRTGGIATGALVLLGVPQAAAAATGIGAGPTDRRSLGFICQVDQVGATLAAYGYLTRVEGLSDALLFTRPLPPSGADPSTADVEAARFVAVMQGALRSVTALGSAIEGHGRGTADIRLLPNGGARLGEPATFTAGSLLVRFVGQFQHHLAIDAPDRALSTFTADLTQRSARVFELEGRTYQFGKAGLPWSLRASGRGVRTDPATPASQHFVSGELGVVDAVRRR